MRFILILLASSAWADPPEIVAVDGGFSVTLRHADTGWDHYADGWRVELADGTVLGVRELLHPHVTEQPFTRSARISVPDGVETVYVRARCSVESRSRMASETRATRRHR